MSKRVSTQLKRRPTAAAVTPPQFSLRRDMLADALLKIDMDKPLDDSERYELSHVLRLILDGSDARKYYGTKPKRGSPKTAAGIHAWISAHFWKLEQNPDAAGLQPREKQICGYVADFWGIKERQVRQIVSDHDAQRRIIEKLMDVFSLKDLESLSLTFRSKPQEEREEIVGVFLPLKDRTVFMPRRLRRTGG